MVHRDASRGADGVSEARDVEVRRHLYIHIYICPGIHNNNKCKHLQVYIFRTGRGCFSSTLLSYVLSMSSYAIIFEMKNVIILHTYMSSYSIHICHHTPYIYVIILHTYMSSYSIHICHHTLYIYVIILHTYMSSYFFLQTGSVAVWIDSGSRAGEGGDGSRLQSSYFPGPF